MDPRHRAGDDEREGEGQRAQTTVSSALAPWLRRALRLRAQSRLSGRPPWPTSAPRSSTPSHARCAPGWRRTIRPSCSDPKAKTDPEAIWGGRALRRLRRPADRLDAAHGRRRAGPRRPGPRNTAAAASRRPRPGCWSSELARRQVPRAAGLASASGCWARCCWSTPTRRRSSEHLPEDRGGEIRWCQGYSEPGAGLRPRRPADQCEDKGDHWLINGQKVWTSYADKADWCFCLVRTDTSKKHEGISFVLIDMATPGRGDAADPADLAARARSARPSSPT